MYCLYFLITVVRFKIEDYTMNTGCSEFGTVSWYTDILTDL